MFRNASQARALPKAEQVLSENVAFWDLLLHPRFVSAFEQLDGATLRSPDYRPVLTGGTVVTQPEYEQMQGLPIALVDLLNAQLSLLEPRLEWAALDRDESALDAAALALRYALVARPFAQELASRAARTEAEAPSWWSSYERSLSELDGHFRKLDVASTSIAEGRNPLGIEDDDLPLYFFGDEESATAGLGLQNETGAESRARIEAYFNVDRATLEEDDYANGATSELAARGLYGDYALFIPKDVIAIDGSSGLSLERVDDILLRFDYVSVAQ